MGSVALARELCWYFIVADATDCGSMHRPCRSLTPTASAVTTILMQVAIAPMLSHAAAHLRAGCGDAEDRARPPETVCRAIPASRGNPAHGLRAWGQ